MNEIAIKIINGRITSRINLIGNPSRKVHQSTNYIKDIKGFISKLEKDFISFRISDSNLIIKYDDCRIILFDYKNLLKRYAFKDFKEDFKQEIQNAKREYLKRKIAKLVINKKKLLALGTAISLTALIGTFIISSQKPDLKENFVEPTKTITHTNTIADKKLQEQFLIALQEIQEQQKINAIFSLDTRIEQTINNTNQNPETILEAVGTAVDIDKIQTFIQSEDGSTLFEVNETYGTDPFIAIAQGKIESQLNHDACIPGGSNYNGYGVGIMQIESPSNNRTISAYNYKTGTTDTLTLNMQNMKQVDKNIQANAMMMQDYLQNYYNGNIYIAIQAYNFGPGMMRAVLTQYAKDSGQTREQIVNNPHDLGWTKYLEDASENPGKYLSQFEGKSGYGDPKYLYKVLSNYVGQYSKFLNSTEENTNNPEIMIINLSTSTIERLEEDQPFNLQSTTLSALTATTKK